VSDARFHQRLYDKHTHRICRLGEDLKHTVMCGHREAALHAVRTSQCAGSKRRSCCIYAVGTPGAGRYPTLRRHDLCPIDRHHSRILSRHVPARPERAVLALGRNAEEGRDAGGRNRECGRMECDVIAGDGYPYKEPLPTFLSSFFLFSFSLLTQQLVTAVPPTPALCHDLSSPAINQARISLTINL